MIAGWGGDEGLVVNKMEYFRKVNNDQVEIDEKLLARW